MSERGDVGGGATCQASPMQKSINNTRVGGVDVFFSNH